MHHKITPMIRCVDNAKELATYYVNIFPDAHITKENAFIVGFEIFGQSLATINGGVHESPNPSISFSLWVRDKDLTKQLRDQLVEGGEILMPFDSYPWSTAYGRCSDRYGVSWQVMYDDCEEHETSKLIPSLMYTQEQAGRAEEAMAFYTSVFPASRIDYIFRYGPNEQDVEGTIAHAEFTLVHQLFIALDSSLDHKFNFNDGVSLMVSCKDQDEVDYYREKLILDGGKEVQCGWGKDKFGVSRQIVPLQLPEALMQADVEKATYATQAMMNMKKIIIADLYA